MASDDDELFAQMGRDINKPYGEEEDDSTWVGGFLNSAIQSPFELFGVQAGPEAERYRLKNPVGGFVSQMLGGSIPYLGWAKAAKAIPLMQKLITGGSKFAEASPFAQGAVQEAIRFAPVEIARNVSTAIINPERSGETLGESAINLGLGSVVGGFFNVAKAHGVTEIPYGKLAGVDHHINVPTIKLAQVRENLAKGLYDDSVPERSLERANNYVNLFTNQIKTEELKRGLKERYVTLGGKHQAGSRVMDYFFRPGKRRGTTVELFVNKAVDDRGMGSNAEARVVLDEAFGAEGLEGVRFPRLMTVTTPEVDEITGKVIREKMIQVGPNLWMRQDGPEGAYTFVKKISGKEVPLTEEELAKLKAAPAEAAEGAKPKIPETRGQGTQYHGARGPIAELKEAGDNYNPDNIYGAYGFYTTDAVDVAAGYQRKRPTGTVYAVEEVKPVTFFDAEKPIKVANGTARDFQTKQFTNATLEEAWRSFQIALGRTNPKPFSAADELEGMAFEQALRDDGTISLRDFFDEMREESAGLGLSKNDVQDYFTDYQQTLEDAGYGGMSHAGGKKVGVPEHLVKIYFDPRNQIKLKDASGLLKQPENVPSGPPPTTKTLDRYVVWQTNNPTRFAGNAARWNNAVLNAWGSGEKLKAPQGSLLEFADKVEEAHNLNIPFHSLETAAARRGPISRLLNKPGATPEQRTFRGHVAAFLKQLTAPADFFAGASPRGAMIWNFARKIKEEGDAIIAGLTHGSYKATNTPLRSILKAEGYSGEFKGQQSIAKIIETNLKTHEDRVGFNYVRKNGFNIEVAEELLQRGEITQGAFGALKGFDDLINKKLMNGVNFTAKAAGLPPIKLLDGHYGLMNQWRGDIRVPVFDSEQNLVYMIGAKDGREANEIVKRMKADPSVPKDWRFEQPRQKGPVPDVFAVSNINVNSSTFNLADRAMKRARPVTAKERKGVGGFTADTGVQSNKEIYDEAEKHIRDLVNFTTDTTIRLKMQRHFEDLALEDPYMAKKVSERYDTMMGRYTGFHQLQNKMMDQVLGQAVGSNSADKIARAANSGMFMLQLGMGNLMHPALTIAGSIQTLLPQIAFVAKAGDRLSNFYTPWPVGNGKGFTKGAVGILSPWRLVWQGIKGMRNASPQLRAAFEFCVDRGLVSPQLDQEFFGAGSQIGKSMKGAWENEGLWGAIKYASEYLPRKSEEMARMMSISTGVETATKMLGIADQDAINRFASEFVQHTMFSYGSHMKPEVFQGAIGNAFGLFKNWTTNYMYWMAEYAGLALKEKEMGPLLWMLGSTATVAGVGGTAVAGLADPFVRAFSGKGVYENIHDQFGPDNELYADAVYHGLPGFFGLTLQGSAAMPGADPARDASMLYNFVMWDRMKAAGQAIGDAWDTWESTGKHPMADEGVRNAMARAFAPRSVMRSMQLQSDGYIHSLNSNQPIVKVSPVEGMLHLLGFNTVQTADNYEMASILFRDKQLRRKAIEVYARKWINAQDSGDPEALTEVFRYTTALGIPFNQLMRSVQGRRQRAADDLVSSRLPKAERDRFEGARDPRTMPGYEEE